MPRIEDFTEEQASFLKGIVNDLTGPTNTGEILNVLERVLGEAAPEWEQNYHLFSENLRRDIEVCMAAFHYYQMRQFES